MNDIQVFDNKDASDYSVFMYLVSQVVSDKTPKLMRIALIAVIHERVAKKFGNTKARYLRYLKQSGVSDADTYYNAAVAILDKSDLFNDKGGITVNAYRAAVLGPVHHVSKNQAVMWRSATHGQLQMLPQMSKQMGAALAERNMPDVYRAVNGMQQQGFRFNKVIKTIPDWKKDLPAYQYGFLARADDYFYKGVVHFHQTFDFRGRMYYRGPFNPSNMGDLGKAMFQFETAKPLGKSGLKALQLYIANLMGIKGSITRRVKWSQANALDLWAKVDGQKVADIQDITGQSKIFQLYVALHEYQRVTHNLQNGLKATSALIIKQDGTCNGIQHISALLRDKATAQSVNLCPATEDDDPQDLYQQYADALKTELPANWHKALTRSLGKKPVMVATFGAGETTISSKIAEGLADYPDLLELYAREDLDLPSLFLKTLFVLIAPVKAFIDLCTAELDASDLTTVTWLTPDRFPVRMDPNILALQCYDILVLRPFNPETLDLGSRIQVRNDEPAVRDDEANSVAVNRGMAVNLIHSLDATHARMVANAAMDSGISFMHTHDEFGCHAADFFKLSAIIREQFVALHQHDVMASINKRNGLDIQLPKGDYDLTGALQATYLFS